MADANSFPTLTQLTYFQWSRPGAARPTLARAFKPSQGDTTIYFSNAPKDDADAVITDPFIMEVERLAGTNRGYKMLVYCPNGADGTSGLSATAVVAGLKFTGIDFTTADSDNQIDFEAGDPIGCAISSVMNHVLVTALQGGIDTGGDNFRIGTGAAGNKIIYAANGDANEPFIQFNDTGNQWEISNDGSSTFVPGTGAGAITGGDGITVTSGDIDVDTSDTTTFVKTSSGAGDEDKVPVLDASGELATGFIKAGNLADYISDVTATASQVNSAATGERVRSFTAYESVTADDALCLKPIEVEYYSQLTDVNLALGDDNARRKYAIKIIPSQTTSSLTTMQFRAAEAVGGATALGDLDISIQTDNAGEPSGTIITNGSANSISQATQRTWTATMGTRTATWASSPTLTAGTTYWIVFEVNATDPTNFLNIGENSSYDENYLTFTRLTFDLDAGTWGGSVTNATPFFWFNSEPKLLGMAVVPTDADVGGRTWGFIGFAKANASANASVDVYVDIVPDLSGLEPGENYYLSGTAGGITTTPPGGVYANGTEASAFSYKIGRALTTTDLKIETGVKRVIISENSGISSTTTREYTVWFKPVHVMVSGTGAGSNDSAISNGYVLPTGSDANVQMSYVNSGAGDASGDTTNSLNTEGDGSDKFVGAASNITDIGFTYTYTESGTATVYALMDVTA